jgi:hypothetical protein
MASLENHIARILGEARECLTAVEITLRLNAESASSSNPYAITEIVACADKMPTLRRDGKKYCREHDGRTSEPAD